MTGEEMTGDEFTEIDRRLREAYSAEPIETSGFQKEFSRRMRRQRTWRMAAAAAALSAIALSGYLAMRREPEPKIFADAAQDHRIEVVQKAPRHWRTADGDVDTLSARFGISRRQITFPGYQLLRAKICLLDGRRVLHLVYSDRLTEYSLYVVPGNQGVSSVETREGAEHVAGFHGNRIEGLVVGDGTALDCRRFVKSVTGA